MPHPIISLCSLQRSSILRWSDDQALGRTFCTANSSVSNAGCKESLLGLVNARMMTVSNRRDRWCPGYSKGFWHHQ